MNIIPNNIFLQRINISYINNIILFFLLVLPEFFYGALTIYASETPFYIEYKWLDYKFGVLSLIILIIGLVYGKKKRLLFFVILYCLTRESYFYFNGQSSCLVSESYEIYINLILAFSFFSIVDKVNRNIFDKEKFLLRAIFLNILIVYASYIFGLNKIIDRYNAPNMDVEATGVICGLFFIYSLFDLKIKNRYIFAGIALVALVLSGSRINLLISISVLLLGMLLDRIKNKKIKKKTLNKILILAALFTISMLIVLLFDNQLLNKLNFLDRMIGALSFNSMESDGSVLGRSRSITIGLEILKNNILGISGYFTNLQLETQQYGFPTFPHSTFLTYYLFLGPIVIAFLKYILDLLFNSINKEMVLFLGTLYIFLFLCLSGGPIISFKPIFFYAFFLHIVNKKIRSKTDI